MTEFFGWLCIYAGMIGSIVAVVVVLFSMFNE